MWARGVCLDSPSRRGSLQVPVVDQRQVVTIGTCHVGSSWRAFEMTRARWAREDLALADVGRFVAKWAHDRALPRGPADSLVRLTSDAVARALRVRPRSVGLELTWPDPDHVRADVQLRGASVLDASESRPDPSAARRLDAIASDWGVESSPHGLSEWFTLDASLESPPPARQAPT
jgi:hypothetical protein